MSSIGLEGACANNAGIMTPAAASERKKLRRIGYCRPLAGPACWRAQTACSAASNSDFLVRHR